MTIVIRESDQHDVDRIYALHVAAFPTPAEARLVAALDSDDAVLVSLVAERGEAIVGHVCFSRMRAEADGMAISAAALAPVAVAEAHRGAGIASALIEQGLAELVDHDVRIAFVLGDPDFYERFGFDPDLADRFASPYAGPAWQALWLGDEKRVRKGEARHATAFAAVSTAQ